MYELIKMGSKFAVKSTTGPNKGKLHGMTTKPKAEAQKRLLEMIMKRGSHKMPDGTMMKNSAMK